jgi:hypothetical protein
VGSLFHDEPPLFPDFSEKMNYRQPILPDFGVQGNYYQSHTPAGMLFLS